MKSPAKYGNHKLMVVACLALSLVIASYAEGQRFGGQGYGGQGFGGSRRSDPTVFDRNEFPMWEIKKPYAKDVFTFVRIKTQPSWNRSSNRNWTADYPDADFYFSWRLHQLTSLQVNPDPITLELTDPQLNDFPFVFPKSRTPPIMA